MTRLEIELSNLLEDAFNEGMTDEQIEQGARDCLEEFGTPGQTLRWNPAFGGRFEVINP
jgi:hypothetical protein